MHKETAAFTDLIPETNTNAILYGKQPQNTTFYEELKKQSEQTVVNSDKHDAGKVLKQHMSQTCCWVLETNLKPAEGFFNTSISSSVNSSGCMFI